MTTQTPGQEQAPAPGPLPLPPGLPESPIATWAVTTASTAVIEAADFGFINSGPAQKIVAVIGILGPLVITLADAIIRHGHARGSST